MSPPISFIRWSCVHACGDREWCARCAHAMGMLFFNKSEVHTYKKPKLKISYKRNVCMQNSHVKNVFCVWVCANTTSSDDKKVIK